MQAFKSLLSHFGIGVLLPVVGLGLIIASLSGLLDWLTGPSTGLLHIGRERGYLPPRFQKVNANGIQMNILVAQGVVITIIGILYALIPTVSRAYWILAALATQIYLIMYVLMFIAARNLRRRSPDHARGYRAPALIPMCVVGVVASVLAAAIGLVPPSQLGHASTLLYVLGMLGAIFMIGVLPPLLLYRLRKPEWKRADQPVHPAA
jgi:amino acid transporter